MARMFVKGGGDAIPLSLFKIEKSPCAICSISAGVRLRGKVTWLCADQPNKRMNTIIETDFFIAIKFQVEN
jgi:hypothetical protein